MKKVVRNSRYCWKCKDEIFYTVPDKVIGDLFVTVHSVEVKPWLIRENHYWCEECYKKHLAEKEAIGYTGSSEVSR